MADKRKRKRTPPPHIPRGRVQRGQIPRGQVPKGTVPKGQVPKGRVPTGQVPKGRTPTGQIEIVRPPEDGDHKACPSCGNPMLWQAQLGRWYCEGCLRYYD